MLSQLSIPDLLVTVAGGLFALAMLLLAFRLFASDGATRLRVPEVFQPAAPGDEYVAPLEDRYRELLELGMIQLEPDENIVTGCGRKGEIEEVLLLTDRRAFIMHRRAGATFFAKHTFAVKDLKPIPSSAGLIGNKIILADGEQIRAIDSPGADGFLTEASAVVRELNHRIRAARGAGE